MGSKKKSGWHLEIKYPENDNYSRSIPVASKFMGDSEKVTTKALKLLIKEGTFNKINSRNDINVHLNLYKNDLIKGRYIMIFNDKFNELIGHFKGWEYYTVDKDGKAELFEKNFSKRQVFWVPICTILILICLISLQPLISGQLFQTISAFIAFYLMLAYSVILLLNKDLAKNHFIKSSTKKLTISTIIFEIPYWIAALITISKISVINGSFSTEIFVNLVFASYAYLLIKFALSFKLEKDKMRV